MALSRPIAKPLVAFDANKNQAFTFSSEGGDLVVKNKLTIRLQSDNSVVYSAIVENYIFEHIVPAGTLINGNYYNFYFNTINNNGDISADSNVLTFWCFSQPTLIIDNMPKDNLLESASYTFTAVYNQAQNEAVSTLKFSLYDSLGTLVAESENYYPSTTEVPTYFDYTFNGFDNNAQYYIQVSGVTLYGTIIESELYSFNVNFYNPQLYSLINLTNDCNLGCIKLRSNLKATTGQVSAGFTDYVKFGNKYCLRLPEYVENGANVKSSVVWSEGITIPKDFAFSLNMKMYRLGELMTFSNKNHTLTCSIILERVIPSGETKPKDFVVFVAKTSNTTFVVQKSNYIDALSSNSSFNICVKKVGNAYTVQLTALANPNDIMEWSNSNIEEDINTTLLFKGDTYTSQWNAVANVANNIDDMFPLTNMQLFKGYFDCLYITSDTDASIITIPEEWDFNTLFRCDFNNNLDSTNATIMVRTLKYIKIKRRKSGTFSWVTLKQVEIIDQSDLNIYYEDYLVPCNYTVDYAIVPTLENDTEGDYVIATVTSKFNHTIVTDNRNVYQLSNISYGADVANSPIGTYSPLKGRYPIMNRNSELNYKTGSISAIMLGYHFNATHQLIRSEMLQQTEDFCNFINDLQAKIIKDLNGRILMIRFNGSPSISYNANYGNSIPTVSANWTEQGVFDSQSDLYENGFIDVRY